jgi:NAD(P)-dependent dehydrogenase (short-subunit alcohol dehydrogenase family)
LGLLIVRIMGDQSHVAVVTGANRGMGLETCKQLADRGLKVVLTSRSEAKGQAAVKLLADDGLSVDFHQLDVTDIASVKALADYLTGKYDRLDVLVNNAGAFLDEDMKSFLEVDADVVRRSFEVNTLGAYHCCQVLVPLMQKNGYGRIVNVSTGMAQLTEMNGNNPGYRIGKVGLNALTKLMSAELQSAGIKVNAVDPGHVATEMGGANAPRQIDEGVDTTMWLATLRDDGPTGGFFRDCKQIPW